MHDMIVNSAVVEEAKADRTGSYRHFVCNMALTYVQQKFKCRVDQCGYRDAVRRRRDRPPASKAPEGPGARVGAAPAPADDSQGARPR